MKRKLVWAVLAVIYAGLFWVLPLLAKDEGIETVFWLHVVVGGCAIVVSILVWAITTLQD
jgi:hypothetical protein